MSAPDPLLVPEPPSARRLLWSTAIAALVATVILVTVVMPAEYGVDPTGIGRLLGLTEMGETKARLAREAVGEAVASAVSDTAASVAAPVAATPPSPAPSPVLPPTNGRSDVATYTLAPGQATEIKLVMRKEARVQFAWSTNRGVVNYDTHADAPGIRYHGYKKGTATQADSGVLVAAFDGQHGWFWRNRGADTVIVTLRTSGDYTAVKRAQ